MKASELTLTTPAGTARLDLVAAAESARIRTRVLGASTLEVRLPERMLTASLLDARTAAAAGRDWSFVAIRRERGTDIIRLVYEDHLVAALRAQRGRLMYQVPLSAATIITRFCNEAGVPVDVDPVLGEQLVEGAGRSLLETTDSWREISALAARLGGRVYSDGTRIIFATDDTLLARGDAARVTSSRGHVLGDIGFQIDIAQTHERAEFDVAATWAADAGTSVHLTRSGPADGRWLVAEWIRDVPHTGVGRVRLTRPTTIGV